MADICRQRGGFLDLTVSFVRTCALLSNRSSSVGDLHFWEQKQIGSREDSRSMHFFFNCFFKTRWTTSERQTAANTRNNSNNTRRQAQLLLKTKERGNKKRKKKKRKESQRQTDISASNIFFEPWRCCGSQLCASDPGYLIFERAYSAQRGAGRG